MSSVSASLICKILTVFLLFCLAKASGGTCLSYGHSCWGGHGKRNGVPNYLNGNTQKRTGAWYISKLFTPFFVKPNRFEELYNFPNQEDEDTEKVQKYGYKIYPILETADVNARDETKIGDADLKASKWGMDIKNSDSEDFIFLTPDTQQRSPTSRYRIFKIMDQGNGKRKMEN